MEFTSVPSISEYGKMARLFKIIAEIRTSKLSHQMPGNVVNIKLDTIVTYTKALTSPNVFEIYIYIYSQLISSHKQGFTLAKEIFCKSIILLHYILIPS